MWCRDDHERPRHKKRFGEISHFDPNRRDDVVCAHSAHIDVFRNVLLVMGVCRSAVNKNVRYLRQKEPRGRNKKRELTNRVCLLLGTSNPSALCCMD